jgi:hypothetical protein
VALGVGCGDGAAVAGPELEIGSGFVEPIGEPVGADEVGATDTTAVVPAWFDDAQPATISTTAKTAPTNPTHRRVSISIPFRSTPGTRHKTIRFRQNAETPGAAQAEAAARVAEGS